MTDSSDSARQVRVRTGSYLDSVTLMQVSRRVASLPGITAALVAMATDLNLDLAREMGFDVPPVSPNDMLLAVDAEHDEALAQAFVEAEAALTAGPRTDVSLAGLPAPRTVRAAARASAATVALVSTPGEHAFSDAVDAVDAGLHTMVFSDNVPLEQEVALKEYAARAGLLVMGPDCGTAVIGGVGLGFANVVRPGPVGIVAASGTGAQHLMTLLDGADVGISHCLGVGGRDLSAEVAGRSTLRAMDLLGADPQTEQIVVVSKPPAPEVEQAVRAHAESLGKPVRFGLLGQATATLTDTAHETVEALGHSWVEPEQRTGAVAAARPGGSLLGLFSGGTLCDEAMILASAELGPVLSNIPLDPAWALEDPLRPLAKPCPTMVDLGDDRLTRGRPHPMIDQTIRLERLLRAIDEPATGVLLVDVVLGLGAAADPAGELAEPVRKATAAGIPVLVSVVGTRDDPQGLRRQLDTLHDAGAWVFCSNAAAARQAVRLLRTEEAGR
jgi:FdrA protein